MGRDKPDAPAPAPEPSREDVTRESIKERPDFYEVDPSKPLPPSGDPYRRDN